MNNSIKKKQHVKRQNDVFKNIIKEIEKEGRLSPEKYDEAIDEIDGVKLSKEQLKFLNIAKEGKNMFLTGDAGTGKSYLLMEIIKSLRLKHEGVIVTASTGIAAVNIGGCTIHSFAGIGFGEDDVDTLYKSIIKKKSVLDRWTDARVIIIDEISMISSSIFTKLNKLAKRLRENDKPFGGIQLVVCGDFFQLPPVTKEGLIEFCFMTDAWKEVIQEICILTFSFRQKGDNTFLKLLQQVKVNELDNNNRSLLKKSIKNKNSDTEGAVMLFPDKYNVNQRNDIEYNKLTGEVKTHTWIFRDGNGKEIKDKETVDWCNAQKTIKLKKGCQVMLIKNLDFSTGLVNGSVGSVVDFTEKRNYPIVKFTNGVERIMEMEEFTVKMGDRVLYSIKQIPLMLAWAITIHKSQGMTLEKAVIKLENAFEYHQVYVALSRVTSLSGLTLLGFDENKIKVHKEVVKFYDKIRNE